MAGALSGEGRRGGQAPGVTRYRSERVVLITFEGGEGSGKTVQARRLQRKLARLEIPSVLLHEPGGTKLGDRVARWLQWKAAEDTSPLTELLLFNASRAQLVERVIRPGLEGGAVVICDRFTDSTIAYQGYGRGLDLDTVRQVNRAAAGNLTPDVTILLDLPVDVAMARQQAGTPDRFERADVAFHQRVRAGYQQLAAEEPGRWLVIDGSRSRDRIARVVWARVALLLGNPRTAIDG